MNALLRLEPEKQGSATPDQTHRHGLAGLEVFDHEEAVLADQFIVEPDLAAAVLGYLIIPTVIMRLL